MKEQRKRIVLLITILIFFFNGYSIYAQNSGEIRWLHIGQHQHWITEQGAMVEGGRIDLTNNNLIWPGLYGREMRNGEGKTLMIGVKNYHDPVMDKQFNKKVVQVGSRYDGYQ